MNDLERDLRELLQRKADEGWSPPEAPVRVLKRVRRRQATTAAVAGLAAALVGVASFAGVRAVLRDDTGTPASTTESGTINGITIEHPDGWFLADPRTLEGADFGQDSLLILANRAPDPTEALGCPGLAVERPEPAVIPDVLMTVEGLPSGLDVPAWPVTLEPLPLDSLVDSTCHEGWQFQTARWVAEGSSYEAVLGFAPGASADDREAMFSSFYSMAFAPSGSTTADLRALLAQGTAGGVEWRLEAMADEDGFALELSHDGGASGFGSPAGSPPALLQASATALGVGEARELVVFGVVTPEAEEVVVDVIPEGGAGLSTTVQVLDVPDEISADTDAFVAVLPVGGGTLRALDGDGNVLAELPMPPWEEPPVSPVVSPPPSPVSELPPLTPVAPVHGGTYWGAYLWVGNDATDGRLADPIVDWLAAQQLAFSDGDLACDQPVRGETIGEPGEDRRVAVYFEYQADANVFVEWYLESRFPGADPVPIPIVEVQTYCLD